MFPGWTATVVLGKRSNQHRYHLLCDYRLYLHPLSNVEYRQRRVPRVGIPNSKSGKDAENLADIFNMHTL